MEKALATISALPASREQVQKFVGLLKSEILANDKDPLPILVQLTCIERTIKEILTDEEIEHHFLKEFLLYDKEKVVNINGAKLQSQETGVKYHYKECGDPVWNDLDNQIKELAEKKKAREKFLQTIPYDAGIVDADSGVFITKPPKTSTEKVVVKLT